MAAEKNEHCITEIYVSTFISKRVILKCNNILKYYSFYCIYNHINAALVDINDYKFLPNLLKLVS